MILYVDGEPEELHALGQNLEKRDSPTQIAIGCIQTNINYVNAIIDNVRIYNHALSYQEVIQLRFQDGKLSV